MKDPHQNIFYYYRGPTRNNHSSFIDKQIEDNTTKSLINIMEFLYNNDFKYFHEELLKYLQFKNETVVEYRLQKAEDESRPDALIKLKTYNIYFEIKTSKDDSDLRIDQIKKHLNILKSKDVLVVITNKNESINIVKTISDRRIKHITWNDIYKISLRLVKRYSESYKTHISLLNHFINYLELQVMTEFSGFKDEDFYYFISDENNDYYKNVIKNKLNSIAYEVYRLLPKSLEKYSEIRLGNIHKKVDSEFKKAWVALKKPEDQDDLLNQCNYTIEISSQGIEINAVVRNGRISEKRKPLGLFYNSLNDHDEMLLIFNKISRELPDASIKLFERVSRDGINPPGRGDEKWIQYFEMSLSLINKPDDLLYLQHILTKKPLPGIHIGTEINIGNKILLNPEKLIERVRDTIQFLSPILENINRRANH
jgi:hypothetical protein